MGKELTPELHTHQSLNFVSQINYQAIHILLQKNTFAFHQAMVHHREF